MPIVSRFNDYWKLPICHSTSEHRRQNNLFNYNNCTTTELRQFCLDRHIPLPTTPNLCKTDLISILETADSNPSFPKFMDLPPELRVNIYEHHVKSLRVDWAETPAQPPLTKISRQIRIESLPVFYQTCAFKFGIRGGNGKLGKQATFATKQMDRVFTTDTLAKIQSVALEGMLWRPFVKPRVLEFSIDIRYNGDVKVVQTTADEAPEVLSIVVERAKALERTLKARGGKLKLESGDADAFKDLFDRVD